MLSDLGKAIFLQISTFLIWRDTDLDWNDLRCIFPHTRSDKMVPLVLSLPFGDPII